MEWEKLCCEALSRAWGIEFSARSVLDELRMDIPNVKMVRKIAATEPCLGYSVCYAVKEKM